MPLQEAAQQFVAAERLFRRLRQDWIEDGEVQPEAIKLPQCSVDREAFVAGPQAVLDRGTPDEVAVAEIRFGDIPDTFNCAESPLTFESIVVHCPEPDHLGVMNEAHSEIRVRNAETKQVRKPGGSLKAKIKDDLASRMQVVPGVHR